MTPRVVVTGAGVIAPAGAGIEAYAAALWGGERAYAFADFDAKTWLGNRRARALDRAARFLCVAVHLALTESGFSTADDGLDDVEVGLACGTMFGGVHSLAAFDDVGSVDGPKSVSPLSVPNTMINAPASQAAIRYKLRGLNAMICTGYASGLTAIDYAVTLLQAGRAQHVLAGGMEEISTESALAFRELEPAGGEQGEGAALWLLETEAAALARGAIPLYEIAGFGSSHHAGGADAIRQALAESGIGPQDVGCIVTSTSGSRVRDEAEAAALAAACGRHLAGIPVSAPKACVGEALGAAGAFGAVTAGLALTRGEAPPTAGFAASDLGLRFSAQPQPICGDYALVTAIGNDGGDAALVVRRWVRA